MAPQDKTPNLLNAASGDDLFRASRIDEAPEMYGRLLTAYIKLLKTLEFNPYMSFIRLFLLSLNPYFIYRFWKSRYIHDFFKTPDALRQELPCAADMLRLLQGLDDSQLRALARCSGLNVVKLTNRILFGGLNKAFVVLAALLAMAKGLKEVFGFELSGYMSPLVPLVAPTLFGLAVGVVFNLLILYQLLKLVRAFDDIISIAAAARNLKL